MDDQMCTWDNTVSAYLDPIIVSKVRYVVRSIYGVHDFFSSYFKGKLFEASAPKTNYAFKTFQGLNMSSAMISSVAR